MRFSLGAVHHVLNNNSHLIQSNAALLGDILIKMPIVNARGIAGKPARRKAVGLRLPQ